MKKLFILCALSFISLSACSTTEPPKVPITQAKSDSYKVETLVKDIGGVPWGMVRLPDDRVLISLREGKFKTLDLKTNKLVDISGAPKVFAEGQGGLLDVVIDPDFKNNSYVYYTYSAINGDKQATRLERAKLVGNKLTESKELFTASPFIDSGYHFGSRIVFDGKGHIFISIGERNKRELAQKLDNHYGKIIRLNMDGSIPKDNPFLKTKDAKPEIWSYGHRNPQGLFFDRKSGELWVNEHGPKGGDEINLVKKSANYAWPLATFGREYWGPKVSDHVSVKGTEDPRHVWLPSIAPSDFIIYDGAAFGAWKGDFVIGALALEHLNRVTMKDGKSVAEERLLVSLEERIRSIELDSAGNILVGTDGGMILRLSPKN